MAKFEITKTGNGFKYALKVGNGKTLIESIEYPEKSVVIPAIKFLQKYANEPAYLVDCGNFQDGKYFALLTKSGEEIARSHNFHSSPHYFKALESVKTHSLNARIEDLA